MTALRSDLQKIVEENDDHGPFVSIFMPLNPDVNSMKYDKAQFDDLLSKAKKKFDQLFPKKDWKLYYNKLRLLCDHIDMDYAQSKGIAIISSEKNIYEYYLNKSVSPLAVVSNNLYILPIIYSTEFEANYDVLQIDKHSFQMFKVEDGLVSIMSLPENAPISSNKTLGKEIIGGDEKIRMHEKGRHSEYRGFDVEEESLEADERNYFEIVDEYVTKNISLIDHLPLILMAVSEDEGEFRKISHNPYLSKDFKINKVPPVFNHETLEKSVTIINSEMINLAKKDLYSQIDRAKSEKKFISGLSNVVDATLEGRVSNLIIAKDSFISGNISIDHKVNIDDINSKSKDNNLLNDLAVTALSLGGRVYILDKADLDNNDVVALLWGSH